MALAFKNFAQLKFSSTATTDCAPREMNSNDKLPVPAHKSNTFNELKSMLCCNILNKPSFAKLVVGREGNPGGTENRLLFKEPLIIRKVSEFGKYHN